MPFAVPYEFALHVHKLPGNSRHPDVYTIGVWEQTTLRGICLAQPLESALTTLRNLLDSAGRPVVLSITEP
jgi:hypothetical protein